ncbi:MAG: OB-fold nucleic acid binding domain-containing protein [Candidatus Aenigmarchaeota archaeon]|nr:OB-fold nucleic acid binding domain-containing protein [Candidatus Aenigmarchaeota archaeon]
MPDEFQRRLPSVRRSVSDIRGEDIRVSVMGTVIEKHEAMLTLDDGTGHISISLPEEAREVKPGQIVRVFGRVIPMEGGFEIEAEIVQDMAGLDMDLYRKVEGLEKIGASS